MIQSALFFILGFLVAGFLSLLVAPAIWRRAVSLTRKRVEAAVPMTMDEIQADKDRLRAEFAMEARRLEMGAQAAREKAAEQLIELNRGREELKRISKERDEKERAAAELEKCAGELEAELRQRDEQLQSQAERHEQQEKLLVERAAELDELGRMFDEASFSASSRQIEMVAQESRLEKMSDDIAALRGERKEAGHKLREAVAEAKAAREQLRAEQKRTATLERKTARLTASLSDRDEKLERRERELARLQGEIRRAMAEQDGQRELLEAERARSVGLEDEIARLTARLSDTAAGSGDVNVREAVKKVIADRERLEQRLVVLNRENKKLRASLDEARRGGTEIHDEERRESALLRDQIGDLAAEVVHLTAMLDEPDSPIRKVLTQAASEPADPDRPKSLAERILALQEAADRPSPEESAPAAPEAMERNG